MSNSTDRIIYMDHAATTPVRPEVAGIMRPYMTDIYANPAAIYRPAGEAARAVTRARTQIAERIGARPEEVYFTSGGSESDNWALYSVCESRGFRDCHIITSQIEHHAVMNTCKRLEKLGVRITYIPVDGDGLIDPADVRSAISPETVMISVMTANNETGTIEPISEIGRIAHENHILMHTDAVQALGHIPLDVGERCVDMMSASAHKLGGPKGVGLLYVRKGTDIAPYISGGSQERGRRAGTLNVPGVVGFGEAVDIACARMDDESGRTRRMAEHMADRILDEIPDSRLNGPRAGRLPGHVNVQIQGVESETVLILLDRAGICASGGSACSTGALDPSHVLLAMGRSEDEARSAIRFTLSADNSIDEVDTTIDKLKEITEHLRNI